MKRNKGRILIVDDERSLVLGLNKILKPDYATHAARDGEAALKMARDIKPDIILLDILMPGMTGFDVLAELKKDEETKNIPVIIITGLDDSNSETRGIALGAAGYITKPFKEAAVRERIKEQLNEAGS